MLVLRNFIKVVVPVSVPSKAACIQAAAVGVFKAGHTADTRYESGHTHRHTPTVVQKQ